METIYFILSIIIAAFYILFVIFAVKDNVRLMDIFAGITAFLCFLTLCLIITEHISYKQGQVDALKGKYKYEQMFVYSATDTIPSDTLYIKIK